MLNVKIWKKNQPANETLLVNVFLCYVANTVKEKGHSVKSLKSLKMNNL